jgi:hypothetical protein
LSYSTETQDGFIDPGDTVQLTIKITNLSDSVASSTEAYLLSDTSWITVVDSHYAFGDINHGDTLTNSDAPFTLVVSEDSEEGSVLPIVLHLEADMGSYTRDIPLEIHVRQTRYDYTDVSTDEARLTITDVGAIGKFRVDGPGSGFVYPASMSNNTLYYASFAVSDGTTGYTVDAFYSGTGEDMDWVTTESPDGRIIFVNPVIGDVMAWGKYSDGGHSAKKGLVVTQVAYAFADTAYDDFIVLQFKAKNEGTDPLDSLYIGIFSDFDIEPYDVNMMDSDGDRNLAYIWTTGSSSQPYVGIALTYPSDSLANLSGMDNVIYVYSGLTESNKAKFLSGELNFPQGNYESDWTLVVSAGPFDLAPGDSQYVVFGFVGGMTLSDLLNNTDRLISVASEPIEVPDSLDISENLAWSLTVPFLQVVPTVSHDQFEISFSLPRSEKIRLSLYDASGRLISLLREGYMDAGAHLLRWNDPSLAQGVYFLRLETRRSSVTRRLVVLK